MRDDRPSHSGHDHRSLMLHGAAQQWAMHRPGTIGHLSMLKVARTCTLGPIRVGQTRADVQRLLGEPSNDWARVQGKAHAGVWCYGSIDVAFETADEVGLIVASTQPDRNAGMAFVFEPKGDTLTLRRWWAGDAPALDVYWPT